MPIANAGPSEADLAAYGTTVCYPQEPAANYRQL